MKQIPGMAEFLATERAFEDFEGPRLEEARVRHDQGPFGPHLLEARGQFSESARPEDRRRRKGKA